MFTTAVGNARGYDWSTWMLGLFRSFMSGGAGALVALGGSTVLKLSLKQTLLLTGGQFVIMGLYRLGEFLQLHGGPDQLSAAIEKASASAQQTVEAVAEAKAATPETPKP